jgi:hypothetical protein
MGMLLANSAPRLCQQRMPGKQHELAAAKLLSILAGAIMRPLASAPEHA